MYDVQFGVVIYYCLFLFACLGDSVIVAYVHYELLCYIAVMLSVINNDLLCNRSHGHYY